MFPFEIRKISCEIACADPEGGIGGPPHPPGKSKVIWVSIELAIGPPLEKVAPPPPLEKVGPPLKPLK